MATRRSSRAIANDVAIREATANLIISKGIDSISFRDIGQEAGLTHGALYARFEDVEELLVDLWSEVLCARMVALIDAVRHAVAVPSETSVGELLNFVRDAQSIDVVAVQVLLTSRRYVVLHEEVEKFIHDYLERHESADRACQSRELTLFSLIIVKIFSNARFGFDVERLKFLGTVLLDALRTDVSAVLEAPLLTPNAAVPLPRSDFRSQLAYETFRAVGTSGYTRATISRISRRTNCSPGSIYKLYTSKDDLVVASIRALMHGPEITALKLSQVLDEGMLSQELYAAASPGDSIRKYFTLEVLMVSTHNEKIRAAVARQFEWLNNFQSLVTDISGDERQRFSYMIRELVVLILGVSFLSTITQQTTDIDFSQFAEPFRQSMLSHFPEWPEVSRQLKEASVSLPRIASS